MNRRKALRTAAAAMITAPALPAIAAGLGAASVEPERIVCFDPHNLPQGWYRYASFGIGIENPVYEKAAAGKNFMEVVKGYSILVREKIESRITQDFAICTMYKRDVPDCSQQYLIASLSDYAHNAEFEALGFSFHLFSAPLPGDRILIPDSMTIFQVDRVIHGRKGNNPLKPWYYLGITALMIDGTHKVFHDYKAHPSEAGIDVDYSSAPGQTEI